jgi:hypothetical protein
MTAAEEQQRSDEAIAVACGLAAAAQSEMDDNSLDDEARLSRVDVKESLQKKGQVFRRGKSHVRYESEF